MQVSHAIQELRLEQNTESLKNEQFRQPLPNKFNNEAKYHYSGGYSWRDIQGLSWIFEKEVYE